jgi:hypothetical protein
VAAGFEVDLQTKPISEIVTAVLTNKDYDLTTWAYGTTDENPSNYVQLSGTFGAPAGRYGYHSPEMVAAVDKLRTAKDQTEVVAAYKAISDIWTRDVPSSRAPSAPPARTSCSTRRTSRSNSPPPRSVGGRCCFRAASPVGVLARRAARQDTFGVPLVNAISHIPG